MTTVAAAVTAKARPPLKLNTLTLSGAGSVECIHTDAEFSYVGLNSNACVLP